MNLSICVCGLFDSKTRYSRANLKISSGKNCIILTNHLTRQTLDRAKLRTFNNSGEQSKSEAKRKKQKIKIKAKLSTSHQSKPICNAKVTGIRVLSAHTQSNRLA